MAGFAVEMTERNAVWGIWIVVAFALVDVMCFFQYVWVFVLFCLAFFFYCRKVKVTVMCVYGCGWRACAHLWMDMQMLVCMRRGVGT